VLHAQDGGGREAALAEEGGFEVEGAGDDGSEGFEGFALGGEEER